MKNSFTLFVNFNLVKRLLNLKSNYIKKKHFTKDYAKDFFNNNFL